MLNPNVKKTIKEIKSELTNSEVSVSGCTQTPVSINEVLEAVKDLGENKDYVIKTILAVYASTFLEKKDPVWLMLVGNPSSNKTTLLDLLKEAENTYRLDTMTSNPFSSGQREKEKPKDLLPLLDGKCFIIKEYGTLFGRSDEMVKQLISDLVAIYDGEYNKHSPTRGTIKYNACFSHIGAVTPMAMNQRQRYMNSVGARFLILRISPLDKKEKDRNIDMIWSGNKRDKEEVIRIVGHFANQLKQKILKGVDISFPEEARSALNNLANLVAKARGIVITEPTSFNTSDGGSKRHYEPVEIQVEEPFRALKQLRKLALCLAIVNGRSEVGKEEINIVKMVALSSMQVRKADILKVFEKGEAFTAKSAATLLCKNYRSVKRTFDELVALGVLVSRKDENDLARVYSPKDEFKDIFRHNEILEDEFESFCSEKQFI